MKLFYCETSCKCHKKSHSVFIGMAFLELKNCENLLNHLITTLYERCKLFSFE